MSTLANVTRVFYLELKVLKVFRERILKTNFPIDHAVLGVCCPIGLGSY